MNCGTNTMWIYMIAFKHIMLLAVSRGLLGSNPFTGYKLHSEHTDKNFLMKDELRRLSCVTLDSPARQLVLDAFLFSCFTGLSFSDVGKFSMNDIVKRNGKLYVSTHRMKTGNERRRTSVASASPPYNEILRRRRRTSHLSSYLQRMVQPPA